MAAMKTLVLLIVAAFSLLFHYQFKSAVPPAKDNDTRTPDYGGVSYAGTTGYSGDKSNSVRAVARAVPQTTCNLQKRDPRMDEIEELIANGSLPQDWHQYARSCVCGGELDLYKSVQC
jgi:hypothetical protein